MQKKTKQKPIKPILKYPLIVPYLILPFHRKSIKAVWSFLYTVCHDFFLLQYRAKIHKGKYPVINVDHELDQKVPFVPEKIDIYLTFVNFWIAPLSFYLCRFGIKKGVPLCTDYLIRLTACYRNSAQIYRYCMTTTVRPKHVPNRKFYTVHALDPHLLCVPSLHITICALAWSYFSKTFANLDLSDEERETLTREIYERATAISESVLYVKQHSVNCIPAAVYLMTMTQSDIFSVVEATSFIQALFAHATDISAQDLAAIREHMVFTYERFLLEGANETDWKAPLQRWLDTYAPAQ